MSEQETHPESRPETAWPGFTQDFETVKQCEHKYLENRRLKNGLDPIDDQNRLWGLALSGGGVRSATFGLGLLQALIKQDKAKRFDYMSTVSGGGYIGSCLSSLLTTMSDTSLEAKDSPFVGLREKQRDAYPQETQLNARHQIHHLRTHGEYLAPRGGFLSRDVQRMVGCVISGMGHTLSLFLFAFVGVVALVHLILDLIDPGLRTLAPRVELFIPGAEAMGTLEYVRAVLAAWYCDLVYFPLRKLVTEASTQPLWLAGAAAVGAVWSVMHVRRATRLSDSLQPVRKAPDNSTLSGWTPEDQSEASFVYRFNLWSVVLAVGGMLAAALIVRARGWEQSFLAALCIPLAFSLGGLFFSHLMTHALESHFARASWLSGKKAKESKKSRESRFRRSLYGSIRGACLYGTVLSVALPVGAVVLFSLSRFPPNFFLSLGALAWGYYLTRAQAGASARKLGDGMRRALANLAVFLFLAFAFAEVSARLLAWYPATSGKPLALWSVVTLAAAALFVWLLGTFIDVNRTSPHYFYRDRLTEAYLKTSARTLRSGVESQGRPLMVLRDDEDLRLHELGQNNGRGPYHVIVTSLNLCGSDELTRKSFLSDHFEFGRDYLGSRMTGWVKTDRYRYGTTRLARAMAISAAAVGSAMGYRTFGAQAFATTLLNARLGYWTENPWNYREGGRILPGRPWTFWPRYLLIEVLGRTSARKPYVNLSDGGHTGDNLGLMPLLRRRCSTILVSDAEADGEYSFGSFNNAVRMAFIEKNIRIEIDLSKIQTRSESASGVPVSEASVVTGTIRYPEESSHEPAFEGRLIYVKSSVPKDQVPVDVLSYAKKKPKFPHETTADQFFDDAQFEAYRALGEHVGEMAAQKL